MPQGCDVVASASSSSEPQKRLLLPKTVARVSIVEHFTALTKAIENLVTIEEALRGGPSDDLSCFKEYAELYREPVSNQWLALQNRLGWLGVEGDGNDQLCQEADVSTQDQNEDHCSVADRKSDSPLPSWVNCPVVLREQMACLIHVLQAQRREMDELVERISYLEEGDDVRSNMRGY